MGKTNSSHRPGTVAPHGKQGHGKSRPNSNIILIAKYFVTTYYLVTRQFNSLVIIMCLVSNNGVEKEDIYGTWLAASGARNDLVSHR